MAYIDSGRFSAEETRGRDAEKGKEASRKTDLRAGMQYAAT